LQLRRGRVAVAAVAPPGSAAAGGTAVTRKIRAQYHWRCRAVGSSPKSYGAVLEPDPVLPLSLVVDDRIRQALPWFGKASYVALLSGFMMTDILLLRCLLAAGYAGLTGYHLFQLRPMRIPLVGSLLFCLVNTGMACLVFHERYFLLSSDEELIFAEHFESTMSVRDFKTLMALGEIVHAHDPHALVKKGEVADLVLILEGNAEVRFDRAHTANIERGGLAGEIGFIAGSPASAAVMATSGSRYIVWPRDGLQKVLAKEPTLKKSLELIIGRELMRKLARNTWVDEALRKELSPLQRARRFGWFQRATDTAGVSRSRSFSCVALIGE